MEGDMPNKSGPLLQNFYPPVLNPLTAQYLNKESGAFDAVPVTRKRASRSPYTN
jgi:hypothetical protein